MQGDAPPFFRCTCLRSSPAALPFDLFVSCFAFLGASNSGEEETDDLSSEGVAEDAVDGDRAFFPLLAPALATRSLFEGLASFLLFGDSGEGGDLNCEGDSAEDERAFFRLLAPLEAPLAPLAANSAATSLLLDGEALRALGDLRRRPRSSCRKAPLASRLGASRLGASAQRLGRARRGETVGAEDGASDRPPERERDRAMGGARP